MREILFRGKNEHTGWIYGDLRNYEKSGAKAIFSHELLHRIEVIPETVGQYSGKNDDFKLSFDVTAVFVADDFTDGVHGDATRKGILDAIDVARNDGIDLGIFEREIAAFHRAVL